LRFSHRAISTPANLVKSLVYYLLCIHKINPFLQ
jgi:hypothetical protein